MDRNQAPIAFQKNEELTRAAGEAAKRPSAKYRTIFISDTHLGSAGAQHRALLDFIKYNECEKLYLVGSLLLILITELLNSSIEAAIDRISFEKHGLSKRAKDYGSAAVLLSLIFSAIVYLTVIYEIMF